MNLILIYIKDALWKEGELAETKLCFRQCSTGNLRLCHSCWCYIIIFANILAVPPLIETLLADGSGLFDNEAHWLSAKLFKVLTSP